MSKFFDLVVIKKKDSPLRCYKGHITERDGRTFTLRIDVEGTPVFGCFDWDEWNVEYIV